MRSLVPGDVANGKLLARRDGAPVSEAAVTSLPVVVIVGRANVGKSTLFNRILGEQAAIVEDRPGITRDRKELEAEWLGVPFRVIDTGGWSPTGNDLDVKVSRQVEAAVRAADVVLFVVDASVGMTDEDEAIADWLRRDGREVIVVANKADNDRREDERWEFLALGLGEPYPISALHGRRVRRPARCRRRAAAGARRGRRLETERQADGSAPWTPDEPRPPRWPSSGAPTSARAPCSTASSDEDRSVVHDRAGHDPRFDRHAGRDGGWSDRLRRHRRHAAAVEDR